MLAHAFHRPLAALAALGTLLALTLVVLIPASAQAAAPGCTPGYPSSVATFTNVDLRRHVGIYGSYNVASITVRSDAGTPGGRVALRVGHYYYNLGLRGGHASHALPRSLPARHTYLVKAMYRGHGCYKASSGSTHYTVTRAGTHVRGLSARNIRRGGHPHVSGVVRTNSGVRATGRVSVKLYYHRHLQKRTTVTLHRGGFYAHFGKVYKTGTWTAKATMLSSNNFAGSSASTHFRVRR
jgi:hypothetical protein